jgi:hypothetical protein
MRIKLEVHVEVPNPTRVERSVIWNFESDTGLTVMHVVYVREECTVFYEI